MTAPEVENTMTANDTDTSTAVPAADLEVDASGMACPLPILRAKKALAQMASGQVLKVITTDRNAIRDFQAFARQTGNTLVLQQESKWQVVHYLRRR
jgi:TusA-related sulfurtransferase